MRPCVMKEASAIRRYFVWAPRILPGFTLLQTEQGHCPNADLPLLYYAMQQIARKSGGWINFRFISVLDRRLEGARERVIKPLLAHQ